MDWDIIAEIYSDLSEDEKKNWWIWFQSEQPSEKVKKRVEKELDKIGWKVDYVLREVSYDIMGFDCNEPESRILFKHIEESKIQRFEEMLDESL